MKKKTIFFSIFLKKEIAKRNIIFSVIFILLNDKFLKICLKKS
jgi:hypothetical protein